MITHTKPEKTTKFKCPEKACQKIFTYEASLLKHIQKIHTSFYQQFFVLGGMTTKMCAFEDSNKN
jgi:hypothetical protein